MEGETLVLPKIFSCYLTKESADIKLKPLLIMLFLHGSGPCSSSGSSTNGTWQLSAEVTNCPLQTRSCDICIAKKLHSSSRSWLRRVARHNSREASQKLRPKSKKAPGPGFCLTHLHLADHSWEVHLSPAFVLLCMICAVLNVNNSYPQ